MKKMSRGLLATLLAATAPLVFAVEYVDQDATGGSNTGGSWGNAFLSLDTALNNGTDDEIWVAEGTYTSSESTGFTLKNHDIYGGFSGSETLRSQRNPAAHPTILSGSGAKRVLYKAAVSTGQAIVDGFTVKDGATTAQGAGLYLNDGSVSVANCFFTNNVATQNGGAVYVYNTGDGDLDLRNCTFYANRVVGAGFTGGDIHVNTLPYAVAISNCTFTGSSTASGAGYGGSVYLANTGNVRVEACAFHDVSSAANGGAIYRSSSTVGTNTFRRLAFRNVAIAAGGSGASTGGGVYLYGATGSRHVLDACSFANVANLLTNSATHGGAVMVFNGAAEFKNCGFTNTTLRCTAAANGGAIYVTGATTDPVTISNCTFVAATNGVQGVGGAVYVAARKAPVTIVDSTFRSCASYRDGGAIYLAAATYPRILDRCSFFDNRVLSDTYSGGAVYLGDAAAGSRMINCAFGGNSAPNRGGAVYHLLATVDYLHCTFQGNTGGSGGALFVNSGTANATNSIFRGNSAASGNEEIFVQATPTLNLDHCNGDTARMANEDSATNMENADPLYLNAAGFDFRIPMNSPMKNRGIALANVAIDRAKSARAGVPDIGAYETPQAPRGTTIIAR